MCNRSNRHLSETLQTLLLTEGHLCVRDPILLYSVAITIRTNKAECILHTGLCLCLVTGGEPLTVFSFRYRRPPPRPTEEMRGYG